MSTQSAPYRDWTESDWYDAVEADRADPDDAAPDDDQSHGPHHQPTDGTDRLAWIAHDILKQSARLLCARTLFGTPDRGWTPHMAAEGVADAPDHDPAAMHHERREVELSEPRVPLGHTASGTWGTREYGYRMDHRVNEPAGYLSGGESTSVIIADRPTPEFMDIVELVIAVHDLRPTVAEHVRTEAREQKRAGNDRDVDILRDVLARIEAAATSPD